ncbi:MAG: RHS repeat-associated core domain-containing protein [Acidimicrobiales bacterium]
MQAHLADYYGSEYQFQQNNTDVSDYFAWNGSLETQQSPAGETLYYFDVAPGAAAGYSGEQACPTSAYECTIIDSGDAVRNIVESLNSSGEVTQVIDPFGVTYDLSYDSHNNLTTVVTDANQAKPSTWHYVYDTGQVSPNSSDLTQVYEPDSGVGSTPAFNSGAPYSTAVVYNNSGAKAGMVGSVSDGTGATTTYSYQDACSTGQCLAAAAPQQTTITYPAQLLCPTCTAQSPVEVDTYVSGIESSQQLGSSTPGSYENETWQYNWTLGYDGPSTEVITYPNTLDGSTLTASLTVDPAGEILSTTNALGDVATSGWMDAYEGDLHPELMWSYAGSSNNSAQNPPYGAWVYAYNVNGLLTNSTDPLGNVTAYQYYPNGQELCYVAPPTVANSGTLPTCQGTPTSGPGTDPPKGSTAYTYDAFGDVVAKVVDFGDTSTGADPQVTTSDYNVMGDQLWTIPPAGQSGVQSSANLYATVTTYAPSNLPLTVTPPGQGTTTNTYDADYNLTSSAGPAATTTTAYDGDDRACFQLVAGVGSGSGLTCSSGSQAGSTSTSYVPGSTDVATTTDARGDATTNYYGDLAFPNSPTEVVDPASSQIQYTAYNDFGNACVTGDVSLATQQGTSTQCNTVAGDTTTVYNALGNETSVTDPSGNTATYAYTNTAYPTLVTSSTNALSKTTAYSYDADGNLVTEMNPDGTTVSTTYDADGRVCTKSDNGIAYACGVGTGVGGVTSYTYNGASDRTSVTVGSSNFLSASQVSTSSGNDSCTLSGGATECWGNQNYGQFGDGGSVVSTFPQATSGISNAISVSAGSAATCDLLGTGSIDCFGDNTYGELGNGTTSSSSTPVSVSGISSATQVAAGALNECAILSDGTVDCWGLNNYGQLGNGTTANSTTPSAVSGLSGATQISGILYHACAVVSSGAVKCWGLNSTGQLGNGTTTNSSTPITVSGLSGVTQVSAGSDSTCALLSSGSIKCWGDNTYGQLGNGSTTWTTSPVSVTGITTAVQVSVGVDSACALLSSGSVDCWGQDNTGQLGNGATTRSSTPVAVTGLSTASSVSVGGGWACAISTAVECWGNNYYGTLGNGTTTNTTTPVFVDAVPSPPPTTTYTYANGQLASTTDSNGKNVSYVYNYAGQVACEAYPVSTPSSCGTFTSPATGSLTNTIVTNAYDTAGRLHTVTDWLGKVTAYAYTTPQAPYSPTTITYPVTGGLTATYGYDNNGNVTSLAAGSVASDSWTYNSDQQVSVSTINGATSSSTTYNGNHQITAAANLATSTSNDTYTIAANGKITRDVPPSGTAHSYMYNVNELCSTTLGSSPTACGTNPTNGASYQYTANGQRSSVTPYTSGIAGASTNYAWNPLGELCNFSPLTSACGVAPANGTSYTYNADGLRMTSSSSSTSGPPIDMQTTTTTTDSTWDLVGGGSIPLNINDATTSSSTPATTVNTSYIYGNLLFGGTAPVEQISGSSASFLVSNQTGVQGVVNSSGTVQEKAIYSIYGSQTIQAGTKVTPFGLQGSYTDLSGLIYLVNRYYDPSTDQFLSIDPLVTSTNQPYVFTNDDPLNATDPLGEWNLLHAIASGFDTTRHFVATHKVADGIVLGVLSVATGGTALVLTAAVEGSAAATAFGAAATVSGFGANALDANACVKQHSKAACGGMALGFIGSVSGGASVLGPSLGLSATTSYRLGALSLTTGAIAVSYDGTIEIIRLIPSHKKR